MLFSFESPICLLAGSLEYNDYDFILYHLLEKYPKYKEFYLKNKDRFTILDNSAYEYFISGKKFDEAKFIKSIEEIDPDVYLIPDVLRDKDKTIAQFDNWIVDHKNISNKRMVVPQGNSFEEWLECYMYFYERQEHFDYVGISFHFSFQKSLGKSLNILKFVGEDYYYALGRRYLLKFLIDNKLLMDKPYHLLGSHCLLEFSWYKNYGWDFIKTVDTGLPIKMGIKEIELSTFLEEKVDIIMDNFINKKLNQKQKMCIIKNIYSFKEYFNNN